MKIIIFQLFAVAVNHHGLMVVAHDDDWFSGDGTSTPSLSPSLLPSLQPASLPSLQPSSLPSLRPSIAPSNVQSEVLGISLKSLRKYELYAVMEFDQFQEPELDSVAQQVLQNVASELILASLNSQRSVDLFRVKAKITDFSITHLSSQDSHSHRGIRIYMDLSVQVRSGTEYTTKSLIQRISSTFNQTKVKETFIVQLQKRDNKTFYPINLMTKFTISDMKTQPLVSARGEQKHQWPDWLIAMCAIFLVTQLFITILLVYRLHRKSKLRPLPLEKYQRSLSGCLSYSPKQLLSEQFVENPTTDQQLSLSIEFRVLVPGSCDDSTCTPCSDQRFKETFTTHPNTVDIDEGFHRESAAVHLNDDSISMSDSFPLPEFLFEV